MNRSIRLIALAAAISVLPLAGCRHEHTPGPAATCTAPQICVDCGEVLAQPLGHTPGADATCTFPQTCAVCGEVLAQPLGHTPGPEATCSSAQVCTVCGEELTPPKEHTPGPAATCTTPQTCQVCGKELVKATGHKVGANGKCTVCGAQVVAKQNEARYTPPGGPASNDAQKPASLIPETQNTGHYHNNLNAYYANAVLVCGDYAMEYFDPDPSGSGYYAGVVNAFAAKYQKLNVTSLIVPKCAAFESPKGYPDPRKDTAAFIANTYKKMDKRVKTADAMGIMAQHAGEYMFYRTDHHWTGLGAYYASVAYCRANGITPYELSSYDTVTNTGFIGTLHYYADYPACLEKNPDYTVGHYPHVGYTMSYQSGGNWYPGTAIDSSSNSYAGMYIGGDLPLTVFETENHNGRSLLVFKESYGNAFVPYMLDYYQRVVVADIRHFDGSTAKLIKQYAITDAVIINNVQAVGSLADMVERVALS
ncbi:MAG: DHHW family protein [Acutalibacteraceae bacterium]|jgi:hypothetical protein